MPILVSPHATTLEARGDTVVALRHYCHRPSSILVQDSDVFNIYDYLCFVNS